MTALRTLMACLFGWLVVLPHAARAEELTRFAVYYTGAESTEPFASYNVLVFDSHAHPPLPPLSAEGKTLLGYVSLVEVAEYRPYVAEAEARGLLLDAGDGLRIADVRKPEWTAYVIETLIPQLIREGFHGAMLDTADTAIHLEEKDPARYGGMTKALTGLIRTIHQHYPEFRLMLNRGFATLPDVAGSLDMILAESIYSTVDKEGSYILQPEEHYLSVANMLKGLKEKHPGLAVYTLDYWPPDDTEGVKAIYAAQRAQGFIPYVSTPDLQQLREEPR